MAKPDGQDEPRANLFGDALPELPPSERLAEIWRDFGRAGDGFCGPVPFSWAEIAAFTRLTGIDLHPAEASCLVEMSRQFCIEIADRNPMRIAPMERTA